MSEDVIDIGSDSDSNRPDVTVVESASTDELHYNTIEGYIKNDQKEVCDAFFGQYCQVKMYIL